MRTLFRRKQIPDILKQLEANQLADGHGALGKHLKVRDLTAFGIAAIIGAGIFSTIGEASYQARRYFLVFIHGNCLWICCFCLC
jgi:APA family basic amino acid/polyamine antiporter